MPTIDISKETKMELDRIRGALMFQQPQKKWSYNTIIQELINRWRGKE